MTSISVTAFQGRAIYEDIPWSLDFIKKTLQKAHDEEVDILCFPECYLQGYVLDKVKAGEIAIDLNSQEFHDILKNIYSNRTTVILGLIERDKANIYNTAVVIKQGELKGKYRKQNLLNKESFFTPGVDSPVFREKNIGYGINICSDTRLPGLAGELAKKEAKILFFPLNNSLPHDIANKWKDKHIGYWIKRARETSCWVITADVVKESRTNTGYGFTTIINPDGNVVESVEHFRQGELKKHVLEF